jgi:homoserine kinase
MNSVCAFAPATIANLNVGFDVLGMALSKVGDKVEVTLNGTPDNRINEIIGGDGLPTETDKNCCSVVIRKMQE